MHTHQATTFRLFLACMFLSVVLALEIIGFKYSGSLILLAHLAEVSADALGFIAALLVSIYSWRADSQGRLHTKNHPEEDLNAKVNLTVMGIGVAYALVRSVMGLFNPEVIDSYWALIGPAVSVGIYLLINSVITSTETSWGTETLKSHTIGDVLASTIVLATSVIALTIGISWVNPTGAIFIVIVLGWIWLVQLDRYVVDKSLTI